MELYVDSAKMDEIKKALNLYDLLEKLIESDHSKKDTKSFDEDMATVIKAFSKN